MKSAFVALVFAACASAPMPAPQVDPHQAAIEVVCETLTAPSFADFDKCMTVLSAMHAQHASIPAQ